jgi:hypothetical protein
MFPGSDVFACIPFHAAHTILDGGIFFFVFLIRKYWVLIERELHVYDGF